MKPFHAVLLAVYLLSGGFAPARGSTIVAWGNPDNLQTNIPADLTNAVAIGAGAGHGLALLENGTVRNWGNDYGGAGPVPAGLSNVTAIACGDHHCVVLKDDGTLAAWKYYFDEYGQATIPTGLSNVIAIAAGGYHTLALKADGTVIAFGRNTYSSPNYGESLVPPGLSNVVGIAAGQAQSLASRADGTVVYWGWRYTSDAAFAAGLSNVAALAAGFQYSLALRRDGTVQAWGNGASFPPLTNVPPGLTNVVAVAGHSSHSLALQRGVVTAWGYNTYDQTNVPANLSSVLAIAAGSEFSVALAGEGNLRIIQLPRSVTAVVGETALFRCGVVGQSPISASWHFNDTPLPGQTNPVLALTQVTPALAGPYHFTASNVLGGVQSAPAFLNVQPLAITSQPTNLTVYGGDNAAFQVQARIVGPFAYQWRHDATNLPGETSFQISLTNVTREAAGNYSVVVSNPYGSLVSSEAMLDVVAVSFLTQPTNRTIYVGDNVTFAVSAWKNGPFTYQWRFNGADLSGQTNAALTLANATTNQSGAYSVLVSNPYGSLESSNAALTVVDSPPLLLSQPGRQTVWHLGRATFSVSANGSKPLSYQWRLNGQDIPGATNVTFSVTGLVANASSSYSVLVSNPVGTTPSTNAVLTVTPLAYWGTSQTSIRTAPTLTNPVTIASGGGLGLALRTNGTVLGWGFLECPPAVPAGLSNIAGLAVGYLHCLAVRSNGTVVAWGCNSSGQINVPVGLSNVLAVAAGTAHSLALKADGTVTSWGSSSAAVPVSLRSVMALAAGGGFSVALKADGTVTAWGPNTYGETNVPLGTSNVVAIAAGDYHGLALKSDGSVVSWGARSPVYNYGQTNVPAGLSNVVAIGAGITHSLAVRSDGTVVAWGRNISGQTNPPVGLSNVFAVVGGDQHSIAQVSADGIALARQPLNATVAQGKPALLSAAATSSQPVAYQWRHNATNIAAATNSWLLLAAAQPADEGGYSVVMSNALGTITSRDALVILTDRPPSIVTQPSSMAVSSPTPATLSVSAVGSPLLKYQWRKDGLAIPAATNSTFALTNPHRTNGGYYSVAVSNTFGLVLSDEVRLRVVAPQQLGSPTLLPDGSVAFTAGDSDGGVLAANDLAFFSVWASTNLVDWEPLPGALSLSNGLLWLRDYTNTDHPQRFFRIGEKLAWRVPVPQRLTEPSPQPGGAKLLMFGESNGERLTPADLAKFQVWASTNLTIWQQLAAPLALTNGRVWLLDTSAANFPQRFYRVIEIP